MVEAVTVWGYAMFVWIPVSVRAYSLLGYQAPINAFSDSLHRANCPTSLGFVRYCVRPIGLLPRRQHLPGFRICMLPSDCIIHPVHS